MVVPVLWPGVWPQARLCCSGEQERALWTQRLGVRSPGKAGKQRLAESAEQQEVALGEEPCPGTRSLARRGARGAEHRLLAATKPLASQALPRPQGQTGTRIPQAGQTSRWRLLWFTDGSGAEGTPNHTGGHGEAGPAPGLPARPAGFSASTGPPCLQASPTGAAYPAALLPPLQNLGGPRTHGPSGARPWAGPEDAEAGARGPEAPACRQLRRTSQTLCMALPLLSALPSLLLADPHPTPPSDLRPCSSGLGLDRSSKMASLAP